MYLPLNVETTAGTDWYGCQRTRSAPAEASARPTGFSWCSAWASRPERKGRTTSRSPRGAFRALQRSATTAAPRGTKSSEVTSRPPASRWVQVGHGSAAKLTEAGGGSLRGEEFAGGRCVAAEAGALEPGVVAAHQGHPAGGRRCRREQEGVVAPGARAGNRAGGEAAEPVGLQPFESGLHGTSCRRVRS